MLRIRIILIRIRIQDMKKFATDPDPCRPNFDTDPDPGKNDTDLDPDPGKNDIDPDSDQAKNVQYGTRKIKKLW